MKLSDKETYAATLAYAKYKATLTWWKIILLGIMGGAFVAIGYTGAITMKSSGGDSTLSTFLAAAIFPTGIMMCIFIGGSLFTSDSLSLMPVVHKEVKPLTALKGLGLVLLGNFIGAFIIAFIAWMADFYQTGAKREVLQHYLEGKQDMSWYTSFFSGILCNLLVAGSVWMSLSTKSAIGKVFLLWFPITLFAMAGFQHIVANFFIFWSGIFMDGASYTEESSTMIAGTEVVTTVTHEVKSEAGEFIANNLVTTMLGNWVGGAILIPGAYMLMNRANMKTLSNVGVSEMPVGDDSNEPSNTPME